MQARRRLAESMALVNRPPGCRSMVLWRGPKRAYQLPFTCHYLNARGAIRIRGPLKRWWFAWRVPAIGDHSPLHPHLWASGAAR